jgi:hypothetical protein
MKSLEIIPKTVGFLNPEGVRDSIPAGGANFTYLSITFKEK